MNDDTSNENADLEAKLRTALSETAAQIDPQPDAVPTEATVTPLHRQNRAWMPALAAAAVVLLIVGVVTLINRGGGGETVAGAGPELLLYLPEGQAPGPDTQSAAPSPSPFPGDMGTAPWTRTMAPYEVVLMCEEHVDGSCRSLLGGASAYFTFDGTPMSQAEFSEWEITDGPEAGRELDDPGYMVSVRFGSDDQTSTASWFDRAAAENPDAEIVEVDVNGRAARYLTGTNDGNESTLVWIVDAPGDGQDLEVVVSPIWDSGAGPTTEEVIEFARSLVEHRVPVPDQLPVQVSSLDDLDVIAGAWSPPPPDGSQEGEVPQDACTTAIPRGNRGDYVGHCAEVGSLTWWEIPDALGSGTEIVLPDGDVGIQRPDDDELLPPSGYVVGTAPIDAAAVEVDFTLADGSTSTQTVDVVGAEYGFTAGFFAVDGGEGAALLDVRILGPAPASTDELLLYLPPDGYVGTGDPLAGARWYWTKEIESYGVDVWCDRFEAGVCRSVVGAASGEFVSDTSDDPDGYTVRFTYLGDGTSAWAQAHTQLESPEGPSDVVLIGDVPGTHFPEASTVLVQPAENVLVEISGGEGDDVVEFARSLVLHAAPIPEYTPVLIAEFDNLTAVAGAWGTTLSVPDPFASDGESDSSVDSAACVTVHSNEVFVDGPTLIEAHCSTTVPGPGLSAGWNPDPDSFGAVTIDGIAPLGVTQLEVVVEFADGTASTHLVDVVGSDYGFTTGFWILRVPAPASITDVQYSVAGAG